MKNRTIRLPVVSGPELNAAPGEVARFEERMFAIQLVVAVAYSGGAVAGLFGFRGPALYAAVGWIAAYHAARLVYVATVARRGGRNRWAEFVIPALDISCITAGWLVLRDPHSPFWAVYLVGLVVHARHIRGDAYRALALLTMVNVLVVRMAGAALEGGVWFDTDLVVMELLVAVMAAFALTIGEAWQRAEARTRALAEQDPLTGVANRRAFVNLVEGMAADERGEFSLLMVDVDNFKRLNDENGHVYGDAVLVAVAEALAGNIRADDRVARYGGDEFVVVMPAASAPVAAVVAERLRVVAQAELPVTLTIGCATRQPREDAESVLRRADALLLDAKRAGKNAILFSEMARTA